MKKFKIMLCACLVLFSGVILTACGAQKFDANKIVVGINEFVYNGISQAYAVTYEGVDVNVQYSFTDNKKSFKPLQNLNIKNVGTYNLYYKISAKGYKDFISSAPVKVTITPATYGVTMFDYELLKTYVKQNTTFDNIVSNFGYTTSRPQFANDDVQLNFVIGNEKTNTNKVFDLSTIEYFEEYEISCTLESDNFDLDVQPATLYVTDVIALKRNTDIVNYYSNIEEAIADAQDNDTIYLNDSIEVKNLLNINKSLTIDGRSGVSLYAHNLFKGIGSKENKDATNSILHVTNGTLTLKNITLNGSKVARGVSVFNGKLVVDGAKIINGKKTDNRRSGGVYITNDSSFEMKKGRIENNDANDTTYIKYCADVWIGANATAEMSSVTGGYINSLFVNSNEYSLSDPGKFRLDGGTIDNLYVEYDQNKNGDDCCARFEYIEGVVNNFMLALQFNKDNVTYGNYFTPELVQNTLYVGGEVVPYELNGTKRESANIFVNEIYNENIDELLENQNSYVFENCTFNAPISTTKKVDLIFNNCTFNANETNLYLTSVTSLIVNKCSFAGNVASGYAIELNLYSTNCKDVIISNCNFKNVESANDTAVSVKQRLGVGDYPPYATNPWAQTATKGTILGTVLVFGNIFGDNMYIEIGTNPEGTNTSANLSTGDFHVVVDQNKEALVVNNKFKNTKDFSGNVESKGLVDLQAKGSYDSNNN